MGDFERDGGRVPAIVTILMVAIMVVLAAVLYVMVIGFGGTNATLTGSLVAERTTQGGYVVYNIRLMSVSSSTIKSDNVEPFVTPSDGVALDGGYISNLNSYLSTGDYLIIGNLTAGTGYSVVMRYIPAGGTFASTSFIAF